METISSEMRVFGSRIATSRSVFPHLTLLALFGVLTPVVKGINFFDPEILAAYACLGLLFAGPATSQLFAEGMASSFDQAWARALIGFLYGEAVSLILLGAGIGMVYVVNRGRYVPAPDWSSLTKSAAFGLAGAAMFASLAAWITVGFSRRMATMCLRILFFGLLILFFYRGRRLPDVGLDAAAICLAMAGFFFLLLKKACP